MITTKSLQFILPTRENTLGYLNIFIRFMFQK